MRILFTSTAGLGHLLPLLSLAGAAAEAGHSVRVATPLQNADRVIGRNLSWHDLAEPTQAERDQVWTDAPDEEHAGIQIFGRLNPLAALPGLEALVADERPDLVVSEGAEFAGGLAAERAGLPVVRVHPGLVLDHLWEGLVAPKLSRPSGSELGLEADPTGRAAGRRPAAQLLPERVRTRAGPGGRHPGTPSWSAATGPRIASRWST